MRFFIFFSVQNATEVILKDDYYYFNILNFKIKE